MIDLLVYWEAVGVTRLYIVRHGETQWNRDRKLQGWNDSDLTEKGRLDARLLRERLKNIRFDTVYSSSSGRALKTAKLLLHKRNEKIIEEDNLREIYLGDWQGQTHEALKKQFPSEFTTFINRKGHYKPVTGESFADVQYRVRKVIEQISAEQPIGNVLLVTHSVCIEVMIAFYKNIPLDQLGTVPFIDGTSLTLLEKNNQKVDVKLIGDVQHLMVR